MAQLAEILYTAPDTNRTDEITFTYKKSTVNIEIKISEPNFNACWSFYDDSLSTAEYLILNNNTGTITGATKITGIRNNCLSFNSSNNDYVSCGNDASLNFELY